MFWKKIISLAAAAVMSCAVCSSFDVYAAAGITLSVGFEPGQYKKGDTFSVTLDISNNSGIAGLKTMLDYDSDVFEYVASEAGIFGDLTFMSDVSYKVDPFIAGFTSIGEDDERNYTDNGTFCTVTFKVKDDVRLKEGDFSFELTYNPNEIFDCDIKNVKVAGVTYPSGYITIGHDLKEETVLPTGSTRGCIHRWCENCDLDERDYVRFTGDIDGNGYIGSRDLLILKRHLAGWKNYADIDTAAANLDPVNPAVNTKDLILLKRYLANWKGYDKYINVIPSDE